MSWVLVMYIYAGTFAKGDSVSMVTVPGFHSEVACNEEGAKGNILVKGSAKDYKFICIQVR